MTSVNFTPGNVMLNNPQPRQLKAKLSCLSLKQVELTAPSQSTSRLESPGPDPIDDPNLYFLRGSFSHVDSIPSSRLSRSLPTMTVEVSLNTPLADAINMAIQPKLLEVGWGTGGADDAALAEYIVLMLVNGKTQDEIASEISGELLNLGPDDPVVKDFAGWLFREIDSLNAQINGVSQSGADDAMQISNPDGDASRSGDSVISAPTGPRSMRNGNNNNFRGGRDKRMFGQMNKAMDRNHDSVLHRVRNQSGNERISRGPPSGPRGGMNNRRGNQTGRAANIQAGMAAMAGMAGQMPGMPGPNGMGPNGMPWGMVASEPTSAELMNLLQQQSQMMQQISQQMMSQGFQNTRHGRQHRGNDRGNFRRGGHNQHAHRNANQPTEKEAPTAEGGEDVDMGGNKAEPTNPEDKVCAYNLKCLNKDCKFVHQSPAAPPGITIDLQDVCGFGAACKNWKCVGRHPSPAARLAHQGEQDCKFFPNCQNPRCPFRHPNMPLCRNGPECTTPGCKFTHIKTKCKYTPCLNPNCPFVHDEGQQGGFKDKVWTAEGSNEHVSERKFVDEKSEVEMVRADGEGDGQAIGHDESADAIQ
ncbi:hypothetical protein jhhlp_007113 [Lomentospora prolificans]|uniref:Nab2-like CCCH zinc finger domain-containing protein n=1 Tax=Lomentospora prolificans TaxID=41688 RepID=A0A2N3N1R4_9PEZI|nr:hypothetical protein jhhlp_007113 [Lomentospora prolificans]